MNQNEMLAKIIDREIRALDLGCGDEVNILDCIANYRQEGSVAGARELLDLFAANCADAILHEQAAVALRQATNGEIK